MGAVYLAEHQRIGKKVAVKVIHGELASDREIVTRFFNEARAVTQIGHEHIVEVHDFGQTGSGEYYFVMEYLSGDTLAATLARSAVLGVRRCLHISAQIASALSAAHACATLHRDLKPDNIMLIQRHGDPDFVKVLDFGLAKVFTDSGQPITARGVVLGTPQYMSPEACESRPTIDHRADIYSLGVVIFQMTTGYLPFDSSSAGAVMVQQVTRLPPAPRALNPDIPPSVEQIILRCLAKAPDARFASMDGVRRALLEPDRYLASSPPIVPSSSVPITAQRRRIPTASEYPADRVGVEGTGQTRLPSVEQPVVPENRTMRILTPVPYRARRRRRWLMVVGAVVLAGGLGGLTALLLGRAVAPGVHAEMTDAGPVVSISPARERDGGHSAVEEQDAVDARHPDRGETVVIRITTEPAGAEVFNLEDELLGATPGEIELPRDGEEHVLIFRHPRAKERRKVVNTAEDAELVVELEPVDERSRRRRSRDKKGKRGRGSR